MMKNAWLVIMRSFMSNKDVMKKVFIDQKEDEETINMLNQKLEELNKEIA